ncbi:hypothetical protein ACYSNM_12810 [Myroides sp. LJL116]
MVENIKIDCIKKVLLQERSFLSEHLSSIDYVNSYDSATEEISDFIKNGTKVFQRKELIFDEEELVDISLVQVLAHLSVVEISRAMVCFNDTPTDTAFNSLINAYFLDLFTFIASSENFETSPISYLESDMGLLYIFATIFCPELLDEVEPVLLKGLAYRQKVRDNNVRPMPGSYGRDSILYFAYYIAKEDGREQVARQILYYCNKKIVPCYVNAVEGIYSNDKPLVEGWVKQLCDYHIKNSKTSDLTYPFHVNHWIYLPIEILGTLSIRDNKDLDNSFVSHGLINIFLPFYKKAFKMKDTNKQIIERLLYKES